jgi:toxin ParE1/3/4
MAHRVSRSPRARADLLMLWRFIAEDSETAADGVIDHIEQALHMLADHPHAGRQRPEIGAGLRSFAVGRYVLFYRIAGQNLVLTRVMGAGQDMDPATFN